MTSARGENNRFKFTCIFGSTRVADNLAGPDSHLFQGTRANRPANKAARLNCKSSGPSANRKPLLFRVASRAMQMSLRNPELDARRATIFQSRLLFARSRAKAKAHRGSPARGYSNRWKTTSHFSKINRWKATNNKFHAKWRAKSESIGANRQQVLMFGVLFNCK